MGKSKHFLTVDELLKVWDMRTNKLMNFSAIGKALNSQYSVAKRNYNALQKEMAGIHVGGRHKVAVDIIKSGIITPINQEVEASEPTTEPQLESLFMAVEKAQSELDKAYINLVDALVSDKVGKLQSDYANLEKEVKDLRTIAEAAKKSNTFFNLRRHFQGGV